MRKNILVDIPALLLIVLFTYTATSKLLNYPDTLLQMQRSPYITRWATILAWAIPLVELLASIALVFPRTRPVGFYGAFILMVLFTGYVYAMLHYSPFLPCSCGGVLAAMSWRQHFYFNIFFAVLSGAGILLSVPGPVQRALPESAPMVS